MEENVEETMEFAGVNLDGLVLNAQKVRILGWLQVAFIVYNNDTSITDWGRLWCLLQPTLIDFLLIC